MTQTKTKAAKADFADIRDWVFDLDNTLYPHHVDLFSQIDKNMTAYVSTLLQMERDEARKLQKQYYLDHGTTLQGLMIHHGVDPDDFLEKAHAIDYSHLMPQPELASAIKALPGRKFIFTNGSVSHARATAGALGILDHFDDIFDIVAAGYVPKPASATYDKFMALNRVDTKKAVMFEDLPRNLTVPKALGMRTVLLVPQNLEDTVTEWWERHSDEDGNVDYITDDLTAFLNEII
ncbi:pyrimidine 5'-nucleotidase [Rhizobium sp. BK376]|uniref:pyrimidine 5'-nucleotidase n=1 Tax=Rhizobium sp. BK376 TaxID=2512149 RepID=UPI00104E6F37|nr:pyrimidine 5'-nucleotidase [Rhizobium sp. BK376]TCR90906.1 putative hydrolase of the HAD superfamily [Rhizobium sp. BK376]